jgi:hypothetical protein
MPESLFAGLKVIDCASWIAGPAAATMLSDFGADVIKIEPPGAGDPWRALTPIPGKPTDAYWQLTSRNKRSLAWRGADGVEPLSSRRGVEGGAASGPGAWGAHGRGTARGWVRSG